MITIIGIGTEPGELTQAAAKKIAETEHVFLRSAKTKAGKAICKAYPHVTPLDDAFTAAGDFDALNAALANAVRQAEQTYGAAAYLTDGEGMDGCAAILCNTAKQTDFLFGVSPHKTRGRTQSEVRLSATEAVQTRPYLDTALATHVTEIDDAYLAGDVKLWLMEYYADEQPIELHVNGKTLTVPLCELDRQTGYDYACELTVAPQEGYVKQKYGFADLKRILARLTAPDGCPWDKAQTHESIRINLIEEAYEAVDAIDSGEPDAMEEEFGDVLLQSALHCDMAERFGEFTVADVLSALCRKLVTRHTHIFGENRAANADEALGYWEAAKTQEKSYVSTADKLQRLPENFPALLAAEKVYKKLRKAGDTANATFFSGVAAAPARTEAEYGKRLFALAALAAADGVDAEVALNAFVTKSKRAFATAEQNGEVADFLRTLCK